MKKRFQIVHHHYSTNLPTIFLIVVVLLATSFRTKHLEEVTTQEVIEDVDITTPVIIGNTDSSPLCLSPEHMLNAWYHVERMDSIRDTLDLSKPGKDQKDLYYQFYMPSSLDKVKRSNIGLRVIVDTINELTMTKKPIWASYLFHRYFSNNITILQDDTLIQQVKSFPVFITNYSTSHMATLEMQDGSIMMVVQAVDKNGKWKPIEYWSGSWCGNSYYTLMIPPRHMLMTRGIKCSGMFRTKCRMKVSNERDSIYSNEFYMSINETQFDKPIRKD
jgi:hypothetical protein